LKSSVLLVVLSLPVFAQDAAPVSEPAPVVAPEVVPVPETVKPDAPTAPKLEPLAAAVPAPKVEKPLITSAFGYGAKRAWFNGTRLLGAGLYYQGSYVYGLGGTVRADGVAPFQMNGVRLVERHGFISTFLMKAVTSIFAVLGMVGSAMANSSMMYEGYYTDGGRTFVVENTYIVTTAEQRAAFASDAASLNSMVDSVGPGQVEATDDFGTGLWADFTVYDPRLALFNKTAPGGTGYELTFGGDFKLGSLFSLPVVLDVGLAMGAIRAPRLDGSPLKTYLYDCFGVVGRLHVPLSRFVTASVEWILNFYALGYLTAPQELADKGTVVSMPLKANLELHLTDRFFARGSVILGGFGFTDGKLGFGADVGVRL
jgi:hypothetical protein